MSTRTLTLDLLTSPVKGKDDLKAHHKSTEEAEEQLPPLSLSLSVRLLCSLKPNVSLSTSSIKPEYKEDWRFREIQAPGLNSITAVLQYLLWHEITREG